MAAFGEVKLSLAELCVIAQCLSVMCRCDCSKCLELQLLTTNLALDTNTGRITLAKIPLQIFIMLNALEKEIATFKMQSRSISGKPLMRQPSSLTTMECHNAAPPPDQAALLALKFNPINPDFGDISIMERIMDTITNFLDATNANHIDITDHC